VPGPAGVGQASGEESAGRVRLGGAVCWVYGDLSGQGWILRVRGFGRSGGPRACEVFLAEISVRWRRNGLMALSVMGLLPVSS
jgi:hypothetical protein